MPMNSTIVWVALVVVFLLIELLSFQLLAIWFALAAVVVVFLSMVMDSVLVQGMVFVVLSGLFFGLFYPLSRRIYRPKADTNSERVIGLIAVVIERIDPKLGKGQVKVDGKEWSVKVRDLSLEPMVVGSMVKVLAIEGVKLVIEPVDAAEE
jgi:membrane protein implicated in regulation of membrane protease activity